MLGVGGMGVEMCEGGWVLVGVLCFSRLCFYCSVLRAAMTQAFSVFFFSLLLSHTTAVPLMAAQGPNLCLGDAVNI